jgi:quercetin dioxygenase-like cupin family protein
VGRLINEWHSFFGLKRFDPGQSVSLVNRVFLFQQGEKRSPIMKKINLHETGTFSDKGPGRNLVEDSPHFKIISFNFRPGQGLPVHSHDIEGQLSIVVLEGEGEFLADDGKTIPARPGDVLISDIAEPHGVRADTDMRILVTIAPPI